MTVLKRGHIQPVRGTIRPSAAGLTERRPEAIRCDLCGQAPREGKPFCTEHVERMPYAAWVLEQLAADDQETELVRAKGWKAVDLAGIGAADVLVKLADRPMTIERIAREANQETEITRHYVKALERAKLVRTHRSRRGKTVVKLEEETVAKNTKIGQQLVCEACKKQFKRKTQFGKVPRYCSPECRSSERKPAKPDPAKFDDGDSGSAPCGPSSLTSTAKKAAALVEAEKLVEEAEEATEAWRSGARPCGGDEAKEAKKEEASEMETTQERVVTNTMSQWFTTLTKLGTVFSLPAPELRPELAQAVQELEASKAVIQALAGLDATSSSRVLGWVQARLFAEHLDSSKRSFDTGFEAGMQAGLQAEAMCSGAAPDTRPVLEPVGVGDNGDMA